MRLALVLLGMLVLMPGHALAQTEPAKQVLIPEQVYQPGVYDTGAVALAAGSTSLNELVCVLGVGSLVEVHGTVMYSTDGGSRWQEWAPFGMSLGEMT